jgi:hypothetical protein
MCYIYIICYILYVLGISFEEFVELFHTLQVHRTAGIDEKYIFFKIMYLV